jgi:Rrf2 family protein
MKISAKDEYGLRVLLSIARYGGDEGLSIAKISEMEGISEPYVGKITRMLRIAGFVQSTRGKKGGYVLSKQPEEIKVAEILHALDGKLFDAEFCGSHTGEERFCNNSIDCSVRSLWRLVQSTVDQVLANVSLADMLEGGPASGINAALRMQNVT